jgi:hypothetical protein
LSATSGSKPTEVTLTATNSYLYYYAGDLPPENWAS